MLGVIIFGIAPRDQIVVFTNPSSRVRPEVFRSPRSSADFQLDSTTMDAPIKIASIIDEHTRECLGGFVERSITREDPTAELDRIAAATGKTTTTTTVGTLPWATDPPAHYAAGYTHR